jgi:hypothetical protein
MSKALKIKDFPDYFATDDGNIYSRIVNKYNNNKGRIKKLVASLSKSGYLHLSLCKNNKSYNARVNRVIAETFIPNPENKPQVNHKNGIKTDNRVENLEWVTQSENMIHAHRVIKTARSPCFWKGKFNEQHPNSKPVVQKKDGIFINRFYSAADASRKTGILRTKITQCCRHQRKTAGNYTWEYAKAREFVNGGDN